MTETRRDGTDLATGALLCVLGLGVGIYAGTHYRLGTPAAMGPGFFPAILGGALTLLGLGIALTAWRRKVENPFPGPKLRALIAIASAVLAFALAIRPLGFVPASFLLVVIAAQADPSTRPITAVLLAVALTGLSWVIFIAGLGMPLPAFNL